MQYFIISYLNDVTTTSSQHYNAMSIGNR